MYAPFADDRNNEDDDTAAAVRCARNEIRLNQELRDRLGTSGHRVVLYRDERELLLDAIAILCNNMFLRDMYRLDVPSDSTRLACLLLGYNAWEYDYAFLYCRLHFYGLHERAIAIQRFWREPRFCAAQLSFDLMKHIAARHHAQVGSLALATVAAFFGATERSERALSARSRDLKMTFDSVAIRRLYYDVGTGVERFDERTAFGNLNPDEGLNALRIVAYNVQDCVVVFHLATNLSFLDTVALYSRHFATPLVDASHCGNSRLFPNAFVLRALADSPAPTVLPFRRNDTATCYSSMLSPNEDTGGGVGGLPGGDNKPTTTRENEATTAAAATFGGERRFLADLYDSVAVENDDVGNNVGDRRHSAATLSKDRNDRSRCRRVCNERTAIAVNDKAYIGGVNSASSGHYDYPVAIDFSSFYPSIGCQFGLSLETTFVATVRTVVRTFGNDIRTIDRAIGVGSLRIFDYEPLDRVRPLPSRPTTTTTPTLFGDGNAAATQRYVVRRVLGDGRFALRGRDSLAEGTLRTNDGWYEGVEFRDVEEMISSSELPNERRVLAVFRFSPKHTPVIAGLWRHYLSMRKRYKSLVRDEKQRRDSSTPNNAARRRVYECMEKMFKIVANSLYGYLNYERSVVYAPAVAAAITLLSRKTFHETTWLCEHSFPREIAATHPGTRCSVVYRDTDGLILHAYVVSMSRGGVIGEKEPAGLSGDDDSAVEPFAVRSVSVALQRALRRNAYEREIVRVINDALRARGDGGIAIELDDEGLRSCCIMGKKKYWKVVGDDVYSYTTKGFEKNARPYVKRMIRALQMNVLRYVDYASARGSDDVDDERPFRLVVTDVCDFFDAVFSHMRRYETRHGVRSFSFGVRLNPRLTNGAEARFIQNALARYGFAIGDRAVALFALEIGGESIDVVTTRLVLERDFDTSRDRANYFKILRRVAVYVLQTVEGFKRAEIDEPKLRMTAADFDRALIRSYSGWLARDMTRNDADRAGRGDDDENPYSCLLRGFVEDVESTSAIDDLRRLRDSGALRMERFGDRCGDGGSDRCDRLST